MKWKESERKKWLSDKETVYTINIPAAGIALKEWAAEPIDW